MGNGDNTKKAHHSRSRIACPNVQSGIWYNGRRVGCLLKNSVMLRKLGQSSKLRKTGMPKGRGPKSKTDWSSMGPLMGIGDNRSYESDAFTFDGARACSS